MTLSPHPGPVKVGDRVEVIEVGDGVISAFRSIDSYHHGRRQVAIVELFDGRTWETTVTQLRRLAGEGGTQ